MLGLVRDAADHKEEDAILVDIQNKLFTIGSKLASEAGSKMQLPDLKDEDVEALEKQMDRMDEQLPPLKNFILPGGDMAASYCHLARTVCRRAERRVVELSQAEKVEELIIRYLNRLSDYLFVLARYFTARHGGEETAWKTRN